jgi:hypothetical protein
MSRPTARREKQLAGRLRTILPLSARAKPPLLRFLRDRIGIERSSPRLTVTNIFNSPESHGLMCHFIVQDAREHSAIFVAPLAQLAFHHRHPLYRDISAYSERCS